MTGDVTPHPSPLEATQDLYFTYARQVEGGKSEWLWVQYREEFHTRDLQQAQTWCTEANDDIQPPKPYFVVLVNKTTTIHKV